MAIKGKKSSKSPPIFSNEFIIQNHADIVSCVAMVFICGFFMNVTQPYAAPFVSLQHNATELGLPNVQYTAGTRDLCIIFFGTLIAIVLHAILQEYLLDKLVRKVNLSRSKLVKFHMSGQFLAFYGFSAAWAANILNNEGFLPLSSLWAGFPNAPHDTMSFTVKLFYISQIAYWLHTYTELYFEKVKREEYLGRISVATVHVILYLLGYGLSLWKVGLVFTVIQYGEQALFHLARLAQFYGHSASRTLFLLRNWIFVAARLVTTSLTVLVFWSGLPASMVTLRIAGVALIGGTQLYMLFAFAAFHIGRMRSDTAGNQKTFKKYRESKTKVPKAPVVDKTLPEVDQAPPSPVAEVKQSPKDSNIKKRIKAGA